MVVDLTFTEVFSDILLKTFLFLSWISLDILFIFLVLLYTITTFYIKDVYMFILNFNIKLQLNPRLTT